MLVNPFNESFDESVAKASRKTDMYAFALLAWRVLSLHEPFDTVRTEGALCAQVHQGIRPVLQLLPADTPAAVVNMISACWDKERSVRKLAVECVCTLAHSCYTLSTYCVLKSQTS